MKTLLALVAVASASPFTLGCTSAVTEDTRDTSAALGELQVDTWRVDLGRVSCASPLPPFGQRVMVRNTTSSAVSYRAAMSDFRSPFTVSPAWGTVFGNGTTWLEVNLARSSFGAPLVPGTISDSLEITAGTGFGFPERVPVTATITGALLRQDKTSIDLGDWTAGSTTPASEAITLVNDGNAQVTVFAGTELGSLDAFAVEPSSAILFPGARARFTVRLDASTSSGASVGYHSTRVTLRALDAVCGNAPRDIDVMAVVR